MNLTYLTRQSTQHDGSACKRWFTSIGHGRMRLQQRSMSTGNRITQAMVIKQAKHTPAASTLSLARLLGCLALLMILPVVTGFSAAKAQSALESGKVAPMGNWLQYRDVTYTGEPILVHLRTGYERAIMLPEPVVQSDEQGTLTGAEIVVDGRIVAFYPTQTFGRQPVSFIGQDSGTVYEFRVRASTEGLRQPLRLSR